jgi:hypothetical protein
LLSPKSNSIDNVDNVDEKESSFVSPTTFVYKPGTVSKSRLLRRHQHQLQSPRDGVVAEEEEEHHDHTHGRRMLDQPPMKTPPPTSKNKHRLLSTGAKRVPVGVRHPSRKATAIQQQQQQQQQQSTSRRRMGYDGTIYTPSKHLLQSTAASRHQRYNDTATAAATTTPHHRLSLDDDDDGMDEDSPQLSSSNNPSPSSQHGDVDGSMESFWEHVARNQKNADDPSIFFISSTTPPRGELHDIHSSIIKERNLNCSNPMAWTLQQCLSNEHDDDDDQQQEQEPCCTTTSNEVDDGDGDCSSEMKSPIKRVTSNLQYLYGMNNATATTIIPRPIPHKPTTITTRQLMYIR